MPDDGRDVWLPSMGVSGPMARNVTDLAMLLSVQAGYDARVPLSLEGDGAAFPGALEADFKGKRIAWLRRLQAALRPASRASSMFAATALQTFESLGCLVEEARARI